MTSTRATLLQVAERAGVSLASTSRALHGTGASKAMVERVRAAAAELGYSVDAIGRSLRMKKTFQIAFAIADIGNPVYVEMMRGIHEVLAPHGFRVVVMTTGDTADSAADLVRSLNSGFVDGMILVPLRTDDRLIAEIQQAPVPVVVIGRAMSDHGVSSVSTDSAAGIGAAVEHVRSCGRRRIGFLNGPLDTTPGTARQRGFDAAAGGFEHVETEIADDFTVSAGLAAARRLFARASGPAEQLDAVVAANDLLAIGAIRAAREFGLAVPGDVAMTGMDDTELGRVFLPSLTSVSLGSTERGRAAAELVLGLTDDPGQPARQVAVGPELIVRESTADGPAS
ncbi:transcriptional regulator, LacI family [Saccharopolyspora kobensis]|uniref:Transcriptional regulator, LacI family n=2 Tax=Saccharopolyspora kobensis TaxID=146035 RepID=A0A1H5VB13_9PSEU|nr:LacI family DNA-binding transcriptional regulator [Saccharopolyspora kobensis]SEF83971.1 transcriptional regulator, LacI family [Saccharopolyspora kobensis]SFC63438.1 transcriptional regulator, LacI family [Saccharopolyspora kobensis]